MQHAKHEVQCKVWSTHGKLDIALQAVYFAAAMVTCSRCMTASFWKPSSSNGKWWARPGLKRSNSACTLVTAPRTAHCVLALDLGTRADAALRPDVVGSDPGT